MLTATLLVTSLAAASLLAARTGSVPELQSPAPAASAPQAEPGDAALERIQKKLMQDPAIKLDKQAVDGHGRHGGPTFRVRVEAPTMTVDQILGPDFLRGPVPAGGMTHQEFLDLVTPKDVSGYAAFTNKEGVMVALTSTALQLALKQALEGWRRATDDRAREAARKEVEDAVAALRRARREPQPLK